MLSTLLKDEIKENKFALITAVEKDLNLDIMKCTIITINSKFNSKSKRFLDNYSL